MLPPRAARPALAWTALVWLLAGVAGAQPNSPDKSQYNLLNPTPPDLMRGLDPAGSDLTQTPYTVDAGHLQLESLLLGYARDASGGTEANEWVVLDTLLRLGLTNDLDAELHVTAYRRLEEAPPGPVAEGFGDLALRLKGNLWGNDPEPEERSAAGWILRLTLPTGTELSDGHVQGGIFLPVAWQATSWLDFQTMLELDFLYDKNGRDYDTDLIHSAEAVVALGERLLAYVEYLGGVALEGSSPYRAALGSGLTFLLGENASIDAGTHLGLTDAAPTVTTSLTLTLRF